jgi:glyoxylase-like metal-dependent hydrolase (beta-lactamase superfamily II)
MADDVHDIYAIRYGHHDRKSSENFIGGDPHDVLQPHDYFVWAIVGACGTFTVDTGFDETMAQKRKRLVTNPIGEGLKAIGIDSETVENVVVTHLHYDHAGNSLSSAGRRDGLCDRALHVPWAATVPVRTTWSLWCARYSPAGLNFVTALVRSPPALRCTGSAATPRACNACGSGPNGARW